MNVLVFVQEILLKTTKKLWNFFRTLEDFLKFVLMASDGNIANFFVWVFLDMMFLIYSPGKLDFFVGHNWDQFFFF